MSQAGNNVSDGKCRLDAASLLAPCSMSGLSSISEVLSRYDDRAGFLYRLDDFKSSVPSSVPILEGGSTRVDH